MAPSARACRDGPSRDGDENRGIRGDRKMRKPLVEKKRRARINESLQELRAILADADLQSKMENAEVLEMTVKKVENILQKRAQEAEVANHEASERFAAGYIQCMHEVHTFVSNCPGIDTTVAAELLNHLLECMPLNCEENHVQDMLVDLMSDSGNGGVWPTSEGVCAAPVSPDSDAVSGGSLLALSPAPSGTSSEDLGSDLEDADSEQNHISPDHVQSGEVQSTSTTTYSKSMWRPW
ncbi:transcription cofactor HES-6-like [Arapaima gigas]